MTVAINTSIPSAISTYQDLLDAITEETDGRAPASALARFVRSAESYVAAALRKNPVRPMMASASLAIDAEFAAHPGDMIRPFALEVVVSGSPRELEFVAPEDVARLQIVTPPDSAPDRYTILGGNFRFWPAPTTTYAATLHYYQTLPPLSSETQTTWLLDEFPNVYLEGGLYFAYRDMPDIEKATALKGLFDESIARVIEAYPSPANRSILRVDSALMARPCGFSGLPL